MVRKQKKKDIIKLIQFSKEIEKRIILSNLFLNKEEKIEENKEINKDKDIC